MDCAPAMASSAPDQLTPRAREIVAAARELLEQEGPVALSVRRVAQSLGIRAPSIYKHLPDKDAIEAAIISTGFEEQAAMFEAGENLDLARAAWAFAHRMTILELNDRFPSDAGLDAAWQHGIDALRPGATSRTPRHPRPAGSDIC
jgi:AcrR family transcriptional regulator